MATYNILLQFGSTVLCQVNILRILYIFEGCIGCVRILCDCIKRRVARVTCIHCPLYRIELYSIVLHRDKGEYHWLNKWALCPMHATPRCQTQTRHVTADKGKGGQYWNYERQKQRLSNNAKNCVLWGCQRSNPSMGLTGRGGGNSLRAGLVWRKEVYLHSLLSGWTFSNWKIIKRYTSKTYLLGQTSYLTKVVGSSEKVDLYHFKGTESYENIAKGTTDPRVEFSLPK